MQPQRLTKQSGFSAIEALLVVLVVAALAVIGLLVYQHYKPTSGKNSTAISRTTNAYNQKVSSAPNENSTETPNTTTDNTTTWSTYHDTGYAASTGISIKLPSDWEIVVPGSKPSKILFGNSQNPVAVVGLRSVYLANSETPEQEWNTCAANVSADACGAAPGDKTVSGSASTINGLASYAATMQNSYGTYHVTVIRGNKSTSDGIPFVEFTTTTSDPTALNTYTAIMASATFPS